MGPYLLARLTLPVHSNNQPNTCLDGVACQHTMSCHNGLTGHSVQSCEEKCMNTLGSVSYRQWSAATICLHLKLC